MLKEYWSPEQICGNLKGREIIGEASVEHIYHYVYQDKAKCGDLHKYLRCLKNIEDEAILIMIDVGKLAGCRGIEYLSIEADQRLESGHFETDLVIGKYSIQVRL